MQIHIFSVSVFNIEAYIPVIGFNPLDVKIGNSSEPGSVTDNIYEIVQNILSPLGMNFNRSISLIANPAFHTETSGVVADKETESDTLHPAARHHMNRVARHYFTSNT